MRSAVPTPAKSDSSQTSVEPVRGEEQQAVRDQLERVLASPVFRNSRRYAAVLRYLVKRALDDPDSQLKERTIGIEVFGRAPDYDTATDHVVRSAVAEIRKRLAQYYQQEPTDHELRIEVQSGSYIPKFRFVAGHASSRDRQSIRLAKHVDGAKVAGYINTRAFSYWRAAGLSLVLIALVIVSLALLKPEDPIQTFWGQLLVSRGPALLCIGNLAGAYQVQIDPLRPSPAITLLDFHSLNSQIVHLDDAMTLARISGLLEARGKRFEIKSQSQATYSDLRADPTVLIGLMNNEWSEGVVKNLRFTVEHPAPELLVIRDHENPSRHDWAIDYSTNYLNITKDYALILRESDTRTGQTVVAIAGLSAFGTLAAGEFVSSAAQLKKLDALAPEGWKDRNLELVLATDVIRGEPGNAVVVASRFW